MILSFDKGKVIATIKGGQWDKKQVRILELKENEKKQDESSSDEEDVPKKKSLVERYKEFDENYKKRNYEEYEEDSGRDRDYPVDDSDLERFHGQGYTQESGEIDLFDNGYNQGITYTNREDLLGLVNDDFYKRQQPYMTASKIEKLKKYVLRNEEPENSRDAKIVKNAKSKIKEAAEKELYVPDGFIIPYMNEKTSRYFIAGPTGSGKSTVAANLIKQYKRQFPTNKVFLFSRVNSDPVLDGLKGVKRIPLNEEFIDYPPDATSEYRNSLCIFDDIDTLPKKLKAAVTRVREDILQVCRKFGTTLICTEHHLMNYQQTRNLLLDSEFVTFFPKSGSVYHINNFLKKYVGLNKKQIEKVLSLNSRSITVHKSYPMYILSDHNVYLING